MSHALSNTPLGEMFNKAKALSGEDLFIEIISKDSVKVMIVRLNTDQLRLQFINSDGIKLSEIGGGYSDFTLATGTKSGRFNINLYDTGAFHSSFKVENVSGKGFEINSDHIKDDGTDLLKEWSPEIEGLTFESLEKVAKFLLILYLNKIRKTLLG